MAQLGHCKPLKSMDFDGSVITQRRPIINALGSTHNVELSWRQKLAVWCEREVKKWKRTIDSYVGVVIRVERAMACFRVYEFWQVGVLWFVAQSVCRDGRCAKRKKKCHLAVLAPPTLYPHSRNQKAFNANVLSRIVLGLKVDVSPHLSRFQKKWSSFYF